jgi:hypothetical protein
MFVSFLEQLLSSMSEEQSHSSRILDCMRSDRSRWGRATAEYACWQGATASSAKTQALWGDRQIQRLVLRSQLDNISLFVS